MPVSVLVFKVGVLVVHLRQFGKFFYVIFCWSEVSRWPSVFQWVACFLLFLFSFGLFFIYSQWVVCALPISG